MRKLRHPKKTNPWTKQKSKGNNIVARKKIIKLTCFILLSDSKPATAVAAPAKTAGKDGESTIVTYLGGIFKFKLSKLR